MKTFFRLAGGGIPAAVWLTTAAQAQVVATFDDLPYGPTVATPVVSIGDAAGQTGGAAATYDGILWDGALDVVDKSYSLGGGSPPFGVSHSGNDYIETAQNGVLITTPMVLTSLWVGTTAYYGYSHGTDQITINALHGTSVLGFVTVNLPLSTAPSGQLLQPGPLTLADTSAFEGLSGITGYRIDRHTVDPTYGGNAWIGDDFTFAPAAVPEPGETAAWTGLSLASAAVLRRLRNRRN